MNVEKKLKKIRKIERQIAVSDPKTAAALTRKLALLRAALF